MLISVIDLGTNTFNLLIARILKTGFEEVYLEKRPVKLGKEGLDKGLISAEAFDRALNTMVHYRKILDKFKPEEIWAFGTSALRSSRNGKELVALIKQKTDIAVEIISGEEEASLIFQGITAATLPEEPYLILDIGGGSVECILGSGKGKLWEHSFPLGIARLLEKFHPSDPIREEEVAHIRKYLSKELSGLWTALEKYDPKYLVGASGTFDTLYSIAHASGKIKGDQRKTINQIPYPVFNEIYASLLQSTYQERLGLPGLVSYRADMIVVAAIFVTFVLSRLKTEKIIQTSYALKEGVVVRRMQEINKKL